jgi:predicted phosphohydrolase
MKVFAISDLHLSGAAPKPMDVFGSSWDNYVAEIKADWQSKVSDDDVVLLCGDFSWALTLEEVKVDFQQIAPLKGKKVLLRGNHDYWWNTLSQVRAALPNGFFALQNDCLRFGKVLLTGSRGWLCPDGNNLAADDQKIYNRECLRLELSLQQMAKVRETDDVVVGLMHFPPFNGRYADSGFVNLFVKYNVPTVVYGHLHGKDCRTSLLLNKFNIDFFLTSCDQVGNKLVQIAEV